MATLDSEPQGNILPEILATDLPSIALAGNPNAGKTSLFNQLTGLRAKTANFPGTTLELRSARVRFAWGEAQLLDLPGLYTLSAGDAEERNAIDSLLGRKPGTKPPSVIVLLLDATHLERNLYLASQVLELGVPVVVALNMIDVAERWQLAFDQEALETALGCPAVPISARTGAGIKELRMTVERIADPKRPRAAMAARTDLGPFETDAARFEWAESVIERAVTHPSKPTSQALRAWADDVLTHPVSGLAAYVVVMAAVFYLIFFFASVPMDLIEGLFGSLQNGVKAVLPDGLLASLIADGVIGGVGGVLVFLPQICLIFFCLTLLEDSGYLARAALVMDRIMRRVGLPGKAFVPMLTAHACAIPAIMASKVIEDKRDRLLTILILPLLTCSARLPVYTMVTAMLFPDSALKAAMLFVFAYGLGMTAAVSMAFVFRLTFLKGQVKPLVIELPDFHRPNLKSALMTTFDRAIIFVKKAGSTILAISVVLWWLATFPQADVADMPAETQARVAMLEGRIEAAGDDGEAAGALQAELGNTIAQGESRYSYAGRAGRFFEPAFAPLGFDWQITVGVLASFAAREVIVSTLSILYGLGEEGEEDALYDKMRSSTRADGSPLFNTPTSVSLLVFFVLAMQCLPTNVVTRRETGKWRWAFFQIGYMTALAWVASFVVYQGLTALGVS